MKAILAFLLLSMTVSLLSGRLTYADQVALPWIKQKTATECGRAVLASVAARHGGDVETFYSRLPAPPDRRRGYSILQLQKFGARIGVNLSLIEPEGITIAGECSERLSLASYFSKLGKSGCGAASRDRSDRRRGKPRTLPCPGRRQGW
jgi:hypothetical protein